MAIKDPLSHRFSDFVGTDPELAEAARIAVEDSLKVAPGEKVLIVSNPVKDVSEISFAVYDAVKAAGGKPVLAFQDVKRQSDSAEEAILSAFDAQPDVVISLSAIKMGKDPGGIRTPYEWDGQSYDHVFHYQLYGARTVRSFWSPTVTREMFCQTVPIDYALLGRRCEKIKSILDRSVSVRVTNGNGTDISIGVRGRSAKLDDGDFSQPGRGGNLPAGEVFVSPELGTAQGVIVFDGSISVDAGDVVIRTPIRARVEAGFVTSIDGAQEARELLDTVEAAEKKALEMEASGDLPRGRGEAYSRNARNIGELGIGLNPRAEVIGNMLEDEKAFGTCHFAIGHNYDGDAPALIHLDGLVSAPTIVAIDAKGRETLIEDKGVLKV